VPTELTDRTVGALRLAGTLAAGRGHVTLLHVIETIPGVSFDELKPFYERLRTKAQKKLASIAQRAREGTAAIDFAIAYGPRAETIVREAKGRGADLIVLTSHRVNPTMVGRDWGTISYKVGILAACPVLLVK
jgi:nucleotide-binding universal stress UspA family protein